MVKEIPMDRLVVETDAPWYSMYVCMHACMHVCMPYIQHNTNSRCMHACIHTTQYQLHAYMHTYNTIPTRERTSAPICRCGIKNSHPSSKHIKTKFDEVKKEKFVAGKMVKDRNEPAKVLLFVSRFLRTCMRASVRKCARQRTRLHASANGP